jgi:Flp pilus assembly protein TadD
VNKRQHVARIGIALVLAGLFVAGSYTARVWWERRSVDHAAGLLDRGLYGRAAHELLRKLVLTPNDALAHYHLGRAYAGLGLPTAARSQFAEAVQLAPQKPAFHAALGRAYRDSGDEAMAVEHLRRAVQLEPGGADLHLLLADELARLGDRTETAREYRAVMRLARGTALAEIARQRLLLVSSPSSER